MPGRIQIYEREIDKKKLAANINDKIQSDNSDFFEAPSIKKSKLSLKGTTKSIMGLIYGEHSGNKNKSTDAGFSLDELQKKLFNSAETLFNQFKDDLAMLDCSKLSMEMIEVAMVDNNIEAKVMCIICHKPKTKVYLKIHAGKNSSAWDELQSEYEDLIATQLTVQNVKMTNTVFQCNDKQENIFCTLGTDSRGKQNFKICDVAADGSCLFNAITHQLSHVKVNSGQHIDLAKDLRKSVVAHISVNLSKYLHS